MESKYQGLLISFVLHVTRKVYIYIFLSKLTTVINSRSNLSCFRITGTCYKL